MQIAKLMDYCAAEEDEWDAKFEELFESKFETFVDGEEHKIEYASCVGCALAPLLWRIAVGCNAAAQSLYRYFTAYNEYLAMFDEYLERASCPLLQLRASDPVSISLSQDSAKAKGALKKTCCKC